MIKEFIQYVSAIRGMSVNTAKAYNNDLTAFATWAKMERQDAKWSNITRDDIDNYVIWNTQLGHTPATINRHLAAISGLYKYMKRQGYEIDNPVRYESRKKLPKRVPETISLGTLEKAATHTTQEVAIAMRLLYTTGIRTSELLNIKKNDIDIERQRIKINGKGSKERYVYMTEEVVEQLRTYIDKKIGHIFAIGDRELRYEIAMAVKRVDNEKRANPRIIRHTFATEMAKNGANATTIAALMGHESIKTSQAYINIAGTGVQAQYNQYSPKI